MKKSHKYLKTIISAIAALIIVLLLVQTFHRSSRDIGNDLTCYLIASKIFFSGNNPYQIDSIFPYIYPQFFNIIIYPFTIIPYWIAVLIWFTLGVFALFFSVRFFLKNLDKKISNKNIISYFSIITILLFAILQDNFLNGQVNILVLFFLILFLNFSSQNKVFLSSLFLAFAISIKITPVIFLAYLLIQKKYKIFVLTILLSITFIIILPYFFTGNNSLKYYEYYLSTFILHRATNFNQELQHIGFSLTALLGNFFPKLAIVISLTVIMFFNILFQIKKSTLPINFKNSLLFSLFLISILLISPMSEGHHLIFVLPSIIFLLYYFFENQKEYNLLIILGIVILIFSVNSIPNILITIILLILYNTIFLISIKR